jgi:hypothetical protein
VVAEETAAAGDEVEQTRTTIRELKALVDAVRQVHT